MRIRFILLIISIVVIIHIVLINAILDSFSSNVKKEIESNFSASNDSANIEPNIVINEYNSTGKLRLVSTVKLHEETVCYEITIINNPVKLLIAYVIFPTALYAIYLIRFDYIRKSY